MQLPAFSKIGGDMGDIPQSSNTYVFAHDKTPNYIPSPPFVINFVNVRFSYFYRVKFV